MAIKLISENLITAVKKGKDKKARLALLNASCMAGAAFSNSMVGMVHSLGHATGGICHIHHGVAMSIFLPYVLEYNLIKVREYISELLFPLAGNELYSKTSEKQRAEKVIEYINNLRDELHKLTKLPRTLKEAGISKEKIPEIAKLAIGDGSLTFNPVDMDYEDAIKVLNKAYK
jgi:alcohol dehydrogenase